MTQRKETPKKELTKDNPEESKQTEDFASIFQAIFERQKYLKPEVYKKKKEK